MNAPIDHFELFELSRCFHIDLNLLAERYRAVQAKVHPDKHAAGSDQERLLAMQQSAQANDAYQCLKSPLLRAAYLLEISGHGKDFDTQTIADATFLMLQMDLREQLSAIENQASLDGFLENVQAMFAAEQEVFVGHFCVQDYPQATDSVSRLHFLHKLVLDAEHVQDKLDDEA